MEIHAFSRLRIEGKAYVEFLRTTSLSAGIYRLPVGGIDGQTPHGEEEIYFVVTGRSRFACSSSDVEVKAGDILFVPKKEPHHFHSIAENLELLVFFAPAEGTL